MGTDIQKDEKQNLQGKRVDDKKTNELEKKFEHTMSHDQLKYSQVVCAGIIDKKSLSVDSEERTSTITCDPDCSVNTSIETHENLDSNHVSLVPRNDKKEDISKADDTLHPTDNFNQIPVTNKVSASKELDQNGSDPIIEEEVDDGNYSNNRFERSYHIPLNNRFSALPVDNTRSSGSDEELRRDEQKRSKKLKRKQKGNECENIQISSTTEKKKKKNELIQENGKKNKHTSDRNIKKNQDKTLKSDDRSESSGVVKKRKDESVSRKAKAADGIDQAVEATDKKKCKVEIPPNDSCPEMSSDASTVADVPEKSVSGKKVLKKARNKCKPKNDTKTNSNTKKVGKKQKGPSKVEPTSQVSPNANQNKYEKASQDKAYSDFSSVLKSVQDTLQGIIDIKQTQNSILKKEEEPKLNSKVQKRTDSPTISKTKRDSKSPTPSDKDESKKNNKKESRSVKKQVCEGNTKSKKNKGSVTGTSKGDVASKAEPNKVKTTATLKDDHKKDNLDTCIPDKKFDEGISTEDSSSIPKSQNETTPNIQETLTNEMLTGISTSSTVVEPKDDNKLENGIEGLITLDKTSTEGHGMTETHDNDSIDQTNAESENSFEQNAESLIANKKLTAKSVCEKLEPNKINGFDVATNDFVQEVTIESKSNSSSKPDDRSDFEDDLRKEG